MSATWILGTLFFVFIICFVVYILTTDTSQPQSASRRYIEAGGSSGNVHSGSDEKYLISRDYQVIFSPRVFVSYPFGVKLVFPKSGMSGPVIWKPAETNGNSRSNVQRGLRESEYYGWPQSAMDDPELTVMGGHVEFESKRIEPIIRVELKSAKESFQAVKTVQECALKRDADTVCSFWVNPLKSEMGSLAIIVSQVMGSVEAIGNGKEKDEVAAIQWTVPVRFFPIVLR